MFKEWEEYYLVLEKEILAFEILVFSLQKAKEMAKKELGKIEGQIGNCMQLMTTTKEQLQRLRCKLEAHNLTICHLQFQNNLAEGAIGSTLVEMESIQQNVDIELRMVKTFKDLL